MCVYARRCYVCVCKKVLRVCMQEGVACVDTRRCCMCRCKKVLCVWMQEGVVCGCKKVLRVGATCRGLVQPDFFYF